MKTFRDLIVWQRGMELVVLVYSVASRLPVEERYGLADQLRRASVSVPANIAEGQARQHRKEFLQHLAIAKGSLAELETLLLLVVRLGLAGNQAAGRAIAASQDVSRLLNRLMTSLRPTPPTDN